MNGFQRLFVDTINDAAKSSSRAKLFDDFLTCATAALDRDEQTFAAVENKNLHCDLFAALIGACEFSIGNKVLRDKILNVDYRVKWLNNDMKPRYRDVLGEIFRELELYDQGAGQVFTAQPTADLMGDIALDESRVREEIARQGFVTVVENCCGSGALILGYLNALLDIGVNPCRQVLAKAADLDPRCVKMTFVQLSLYCIPAVVEQRNAVTSEIFGKPLITPILKCRPKESDST